jgi:hypothetical protein
MANGQWLMANGGDSMVREYQRAAERRCAAVEKKE